MRYVVIRKHVIYRKANGSIISSLFKNYGICLNHLEEENAKELDVFVFDNLRMISRSYNIC